MKNAKVLVVDDEQDFRELLKDYLTGKGYEVMVAADGDEAVEFAKQGNPDVIILDVMMPVKDGIEACREIRNDKSIKNPGIVILTVKKELQDKLNGYMAGAHRYLTKPCSLEEIDNCLRTVLFQREINASQFNGDIGARI